MKNEKGATIVEASVVFPIVFIIIIIMLILGNAYYQKCRVEAIQLSVPAMRRTHY